MAPELRVLLDGAGGGGGGAAGGDGGDGGDGGGAGCTANPTWSSQSDTEDGALAMLTATYLRNAGESNERQWAQQRSLHSIA